MKKNTFILECDSFTLSKVKKWIEDFKLNEKGKTYVLTQKSRNEVFKKALSSFENIECIDYDFIFSYTAESDVSAKEYYDFNRFYFDSDIPARLLDRDGYFPKYGISNQHGFSYYSEKALNTLKFLKENEIDFIYFRNTPHHSVEWLLARAADFLSISIYTSQMHIFPWLYSISKGYMKDRELQLKDEIFDDIEETSYHIKKFIEKTSKDYNTAIPQYEKKRQGKGILKYYNPFKHSKELLYNPHRFYAKTRIFFKYKELAKNLALDKIDYFAFFLHVQPERTTLPEGYDFIDSIFAIRILRLLLPTNIELLVKEHPSTFTNRSEPKSRNVFFYETISNMEGVSLVPIGIDSFQLIDNSLAVASITSSACLESYLRLRPAIFFGRSSLKVEGTHVFSTTENLAVFLEAIINKGIMIEPFNKQLLELCSNGVASGLETNQEEKVDYHLTRKYQENAHYKLLSKLLK
jgi:hypothetical protein